MLRFASLRLERTRQSTCTAPNILHSAPDGNNSSTSGRLIIFSSHVYIFVLDDGPWGLKHVTLLIQKI